MLNMIKLDWLGMKVYHKRIVIVPFVIIVYGFFFEAIILPFMAFMMLMFSINPFAVEEKGKLDNLYLTLPVTRKNIVNARIGLSLIMQLVGFSVGIVATMVYNAFLYGRTVIYMRTFNADFDSMLLIACGSLLLYAILKLSMFPILFKIGYAKGKALGVYVPVVVFSIAILTLYILWHFNNPFREFMMSATEWAFSNIAWVAILLLVAAVFLFVISYLLSHKVYAKREF